MKTFTSLLAALTILVLVTACAESRKSAANPPTGQQLWSQNCSRCHNLRSPASYNAAQWEVVALHMRVRANLTANEHRAILEFLQGGESDVK